MPTEKIATIVIGGGQAGLSMSEHLSQCGEPHLVLERDRIAESWRSKRWDSLVANGPAWHDRLPGMEFPDMAPDAFPHKDQIAEYFASYAKMIDAPVRCGVDVKEVRRNTGHLGFQAETSDGTIQADNVVVATGPFQCPIVPRIVPQDSAIVQIHSQEYRNPESTPEGAVLVVGAGSSGTQIAEELLTAGKSVYLSVGPHDRPPRRYRGRDFVWWLGVLGKWDATAVEPGTEHVTIAVTGANGGHTVNFRSMAAQGITLVGMLKAFKNGVLYFAPDLADNIEKGDASYVSLLDEADAYIARNGLDLPEEPTARDAAANPACVTEPILELDLAEAGISSIIWATGFTVDYSWLKVDAFDEAGRPKHQRGVSAEPGLYFLGLPWLSKRGSSFIWGVWHDAKYLADHIVTHRKYMAYHASAPCRV